MSLIKNTSIYLISNILNSAIPFILLPILTRYLTPTEYGQIAMFQVLLTGMTMFIGLNSAGAANRKFYDNDINDNTIKEFNGSCVQILIISSLITSIFIFILAKQLSFFLSIPVNWIFIAVIISSLTFIITIRLGQWQIRGRAKYFGLLQVSSSFLNMLLSILLVVLLKDGANGRINAQLTAIIIISIISIILLYKDKLLKVFIWRPEQLKEALSFGIPLIPHNIGFFLITSVDRFVINKELGLTKAGIYMVAAQLSISLVIIFDAINKAYQPWLFEKLKKNQLKDKIKIVKYTYAYFLFILSLSILSFIIGPPILVFIAGEKYEAAGQLIGWLCLGQIFGGMYLMVANYIFFTRKNNKLALITIICGFFNFVLLFILISYIGLTGAGIAYAISRFFQFMLTWYLSAKCFRMPWFDIFK